MNCKSCGISIGSVGEFCSKVCEEAFFTKSTTFCISSKSRSKEDCLADDHWEYVKGLLVSCDVHTDTLKVAEYQYKSAFKHGWKHAKEDTEKDKTDTPYSIETLKKEGIMKYDTYPTTNEKEFYGIRKI